MCFWSLGPPGWTAIRAVMPGLVPGIHVVVPPSRMAGSNPAMTTAEERPQAFLGGVDGQLLMSVS